MQEELRILHLNDLHSHFEAYPKLERYFQNYQDTTAEVIRCDLGDNVDRSHPLTEATRGRANVALMNRLGIQLATIGNNEGVGLPKEALNQVYEAADFHVVLGNLRDKGQMPSWAKPYYIYETKKGTKIAFLAYTFPYYTTYQPNGWEILDPISCLKSDLQNPEVASAHVRILLSHLGIRMDEKITEEVDKLDLIIGSHTHHVFPEGAFLNGVYLAAAGKYGQYAGEIKLQLQNHQLTTIDIKAHEMSHMSSQPKDQKQIADLYQAGIALLSQEVVTDFTHNLSQGESEKLVMEAMQAYAKADCSIINSGLIVTPFSQHLTMAQLHQALPHQMRLVVFELSQAELQDVCSDIMEQARLLEHQDIHGMGFRGKQFGQLRFNGFTYKNGKIVYNKRVIANQEKIRLVLVDHYYFASYFPQVKKQEPILLFPDLLRELVATYLKGK
ncbi:bifunctional metallophosphatase/5'-nucleotidase [Streptococcus halichoeri]|uniref:bifunctional metallophosphatase/5'-nucleotidase n=1 Tax=Streptococcus halichoeri TaxID=254785 RepID=UPI001356D362|nr:bifunctional metallophosphatase/5'-nucleotidase [Streptococcus halichoeri]